MANSATYSCSQPSASEGKSPSEVAAEAVSAIAQSQTLAELESLRVGYLGKNGAITALLKGLGSIPAELRKEAGQGINQSKEAVEQALQARYAVLQEQALAAQLVAERVDVTLAPRPEMRGTLHPIPQVIAEITGIFAQLGFHLAEGPDIEDDFHNFEALNFPKDHPAREMHDTFYLQAKEGEERPVLRTHTSPVQIRAMLNNPLPLRCIAAGNTYRCDSDQTHTPMFHQIEGLVIDKGITMGHLKGTVIQFLETFFQVENLPVRFRPSFFPFTEPSAEVDIGCSRENGKLVIGAGKDWLEVMGCGMVHRKVLQNCKVDTAQWGGFAFGLGVERLAMLKYGIPDLRTFFESDVRWLEHYGFSPLNEDK
jgi:phenylalanyl-tRNA synthetase alpha chain